MGGLGSGMWYRWNTRTTLDEVKRLDVRWLHRQGYLDRWPRWVTWSRGERQTGSVSVRLIDGCLVVEYRCRWRGTDTWEDIRQVITLDWTPCHYGGKRPWFRCPGCQRRVALLCGYDRLFLCRHCYRLPTGLRPPLARSQGRSWSPGRGAPTVCQSGACARGAAQGRHERGHQREQGGRGWADAGGGKGRLIFLYS
jgi:hypothetical protein